MITTAAFGPDADPHLVELAGRRFSETRPSVLRGDLIACDGFNMTESLDAIRTPTLVIGSEKDSLTPLRYAQFLSDHIPGAELKIVTGAGHMVMLEQPKFVAEILVQFLSSITFHPGSI
jgi:pimeloyl-ACP methyl ester carboxylesterase